MLDNNANTRLAKNSIFLSIRMVIVMLISFYTTRVLLATLGVDDYGIYNVVGGFVSMFAFMNTSISNGIQRFYNFEFGKNGIDGANKVYNVAVLIQVCLAIFLVFIIELVGSWYVSNKLVVPIERLYAAKWVFHFVVVSFTFNILQAPYMAAVIAHERMDFYAVVSVVDVLLKLLFVLALPYSPVDKLISYGFCWMLISIVSWSLYFGYSKLYFEEIKYHNYFSGDLLKSMIGFSWWNMFGAVSSVFREQGLNLIMNLFFGPVVNAARGIAVQINGGIQGFVQNLSTPVRPQVIQSYAKGDMSRTMNLTFTISKLSCFFITLMALPLCLEINFVLRLWLGDNVPLHTTTFAIIIILCSYQGNLNAPLSTIVHATGKMRNYQFFSSLIKLLSVPVGYFVLKGGAAPEMALICVFIFDWLGHIAGMFILKQLVNYSISDYVFRVIVPIVTVIVLSLLVLLPIHLMIDNEIVRFFAVVSSSIIIVSLIIFFIGLRTNERALMIEMIKSLIYKIKK